jgi:hypothetical protein
MLWNYDECHYSVCCYAECHYASCSYDVCHSAVSLWCHYSEYCYANYRNSKCCNVDKVVHAECLHVVGFYVISA